jgi:hypothetical protein
MESLRIQARLVCATRRYRTSFALETTQPQRNKRDQIKQKVSKINEANRCPGAHNALVAGSRPPGHIGKSSALEF